MKTMLKKILSLVVLILYSGFAYSQQNDSLRIYVQGIESGEQYRVYYKNQLIVELNCENKDCKKYGKSACCLYYFSLPLDSFMRTGFPLQLVVYKKIGSKYRNTFWSADYNPTKKYLIIIRNHRLKDEYAVDAIWRDERLIMD